VSADILAREPLANTAEVKHILVGWSELVDNYQGHMDPRAAKRTKAEAEAEITDLLGKLKEGGDFETLMKANSEDSASTSSGRPIKVTPDAGLVIEFRQLALRLHVGEWGVCQSDFGFHIIKRLE
jgi:parvulin-like peptidyl-prolyl isomerase